jgi:mRNA-degrading endonuclease RelE of RelBE toxin-antitoxin system
MLNRFIIEYRPSTEKDLRTLDSRYRKLIFKRIEQLSLVPIDKGCKKIDNKKNRYRVRLGVYRIVYRVDFDKHIIIIEYI